jgi:transposase
MERNTPTHEANRRVFCAFLIALAASRLVFIDESFCKTGMRREYARAASGQRVSSSRPFRHWKTVSLIGAIRLGRGPKLMTHRGAVDGRTFLRFVRTRLAPWLRRGDIVVMDNLNFHKMRAVQDAIRAVGATPIYLPTYSPELNPIERLWADMKRTLRTLGVDDESQLIRAARRLARRTPIRKIAGWFRLALAEAQLNRSPC